MPTSTDDQYRPSRGSGPKRLGPMVPRVQNQTREDDGADERDENQKHPSAGSVAIMQSPNRNPRPGKKTPRNRIMESGPYPVLENTIRSTTLATILRRITNRVQNQYSDRIALVRKFA